MRYTCHVVQPVTNKQGAETRPLYLTLLRYFAIATIGSGLVTVIVSHFVKVAYGLSTRSAGLALLAVGLLAFAIYSNQVDQSFNAIASTTFLAVILLMLHEEMSRPQAITEWRAADTLAMLLALGALGLGVYHERQLRSALSELTNVQRALSTRYLGTFPRFLRDIVNEINHAQDSIVISCDFPAYGCFSDPRVALEYKHALEKRAADGVKIELICLDAATRRRYAREQFTEETWQQWQRDPRARERLVEFLKKRHITDTPEVSIDAFMKELETIDESYLKDVFAGSVQEISVGLPVYYWIVDSQSAIFAISAMSDTEGWEEYGFITADHALIQAFQEMRARYRKYYSNVAQPAEEPPQIPPSTA